MKTRKESLKWAFSGQLQGAKEAKVAHNPCIQETEAGGLLQSQDQLRLQSETLPKKKKKLLLFYFSGVATSELPMFQLTPPPNSCKQPQ